MAAMIAKEARHRRHHRGEKLRNEPGASGYVFANRTGGCGGMGGMSGLACVLYGEPLKHLPPPPRAAACPGSNSARG